MLNLASVCPSGHPLARVQYNHCVTLYLSPLQEVTDEEGRRRFHGAFTGGFSAGYYNTVGSLEGWEPKAFKSSRGERGAARCTASHCISYLATLPHTFRSAGAGSWLSVLKLLCNNTALHRASCAGSMQALASALLLA